jgi:hypothetical protein
MARIPHARPALTALLVLAAAAGGCAPSATPPATPTAGPVPPSASPLAPSDGPTLTAEPTIAPAPSGTLPLPTGFAAALEPGTYWSAPPFDLGFAFTVLEEGWVAGHLNPEFVDIQQFEGTPAEGVMPERIISFAHPLEIHGTTIVDASGLTPAEAIDAWVERSDIETANVEELELLGGDAVRVDVHAPVPMLALFGGDDGTFRLDGAYDVRTVAVAVDGGLFIASVHAPAADLEAAWAQALPILESIDLGA